jgi:hypothetical protein
MPWCDDIVSDTCRDNKETERGTVVERERGGGTRVGYTDSEIEIESRERVKMQ